MSAHRERRPAGQPSDLTISVAPSGTLAQGRAPSGPATAGVEQVLVRYEDTSFGLAALEHARVLADRRGARLTVVAVARQEANQGGCAICRSTAGLYNRHMQEIAREEISSAATHVGVCDTVEFVVAKGSSFVRAIGKLAIERGAQTVVLPGQPGGRIARLFGRDEAELTRRCGVAEVIVVHASS